MIYVSTFSKILFPSARLGFLAVPRGLAPALAGFRKTVSRQSETLLQDGLARWMRDGGFERHLRRMRTAYEERRSILVESLEALRPSVPTLSWQTPDGGMAIWLDSGRDALPLARRALELGVYVQPGDLYQLTPGARPSHHLRLGFACLSPEEIRPGMRLLGRALSIA